jgi:hypothetical protein
LIKRFICDREKSKSMQDEKYTFTIWKMDISEWSTSSW